MLGAFLRYFKGEIRRIYDFLIHSVHLISEDESVAGCGLGGKLPEFDAVDSLFNCDYRVAGSLQPRDKFYRRRRAFPRDRILSPEGGFMDFGRRRNGCDSAEPELVDSEGVRAAEGRADIMGTADIVQHDGKSAPCP